MRDESILFRVRTELSDFTNDVQGYFLGIDWFTRVKSVENFTELE